MSYLSFCPPGVVLPYAGAIAPEGWLLCDGTAYSQTTYSALFAAIGSNYNTQTNPTTNVAWTAPAGGSFRVPDHRSVFLRGVGSPFAGDPVTLGGFQVHKTAKNALSNSTSGNTGTVGGSDGSHSHTGIPLNIPSSAGYAGFSGYATSGGVQNNGTTGSTSSTHGHGFTLTAGAQTITGDTETRPHNVGVNYIIKI